MHGGYGGMSDGEQAFVSDYFGDFYFYAVRHHLLSRLFRAKGCPSSTASGRPGTCILQEVPGEPLHSSGDIHHLLCDSYGGNFYFCFLQLHLEILE